MTNDDHTDLQAQASSAFLSEDYSLALSLYVQLPSTPANLLKRAVCNHNLADFDAALTDALAAVAVARSSSEEDGQLQGKALMRAGMAGVELGRMQDALGWFCDARRVGEKGAVDAWMRRCVERGARMEDVKVVVEQPQEHPSEPPQQRQQQQQQKPVVQQQQQATPKIRHEWFQTDSIVTVTIFAKNVDPTLLAVDFAPRSLSVSIPSALPGGSEYVLDLDPLVQEIVPEESRFEVMKTKVEIKLRKAVVGLRWNDLEGVDDGPAGVTAAVGSGTTSSSGPAYPTSSRKKHDWDTIVASEEKEKPEGEQALNNLFQQIYRDATDDTKRAMMKSYVESNGTCLSTNWGEVGEKKVEVTPPDGMVAKKYEL